MRLRAPAHFGRPAFSFVTVARGWLWNVNSYQYVFACIGPELGQTVDQYAKRGSFILPISDRE